jgi:hypothetical protein
MKAEIERTGRAKLMNQGGGTLGERWKQRWREQVTKGKWLTAGL